MSDKTCFRCGRPIPPGPISFLPGNGWACAPRDRAGCDAAVEAGTFVGVVLDEGELDLGAAYSERMTRPHPLTPEDEDLLREMLNDRKDPDAAT